MKNMSKILAKIKSAKSPKQLQNINYIAAGLHLLQAILVALLANGYSLPISTNYLSFNTATNNLDQASRHLFDLPLAVLIVIFFLLSSLAHLYVATLYKRRYQKDLNIGINRVRWYEYALSASTMMVAISLLSGIYELSLLIAIFALTALMNLMGLVMELWNQSQKSINWTSFVIGCFSGAVPWVIVLIYFIGASLFSSKGVPGFVYGIYASIFVAFNCFAVNMYLQYKKIGPWKNYLFGEKMYMILSLLAKSALAWQVFAGSLR